MIYKGNLNMNMVLVCVGKNDSMVVIKKVFTKMMALVLLVGSGDVLTSDTTLKSKQKSVWPSIGIVSYDTESEYVRVEAHPAATASAFATWLGLSSIGSLWRYKRNAARLKGIIPMQPLDMNCINDLNPEKQCESLRNNFLEDGVRRVKIDQICEHNNIIDSHNASLSKFIRAVGVGRKLPFFRRRIPAMAAVGVYYVVASDNRHLSEIVHRVENHLYAENTPVYDKN